MPSISSDLTPLTDALCLPRFMFLRSSGGAIAGSVSQYIGRRLTIIIFVVWAGAFIPLWILPNSFSGLSAGAFWLQFGVQGAWGVIPIQLAEMSPPGFRATFPGVTYQLGNVRRLHFYVVWLIG
jgi:MFS family permease